MSKQNKIPYDASPIVRDSGSNFKQTPVRNKISNSIFVAAIFIFNIVISALFINYLLTNKKDDTIIINNNVVAQGSISDVALTKAKLSSVCIGSGGTDKDGVSFSSENIPDYNELLKRSAHRGSGVLIDVNKTTGEAYILTCNHVVNGNTFVLLYDSISPIMATVVGKSIYNDLAVLKIQSEQVKGACQAAQIADSSYVSTGDEAIAVGNPQSNGFAVTIGYVSRTNVFVSASGLTLRTLQIQTPINGGNSGGGLFDKNGALIGIVESKTASDSIDNVAFAIHSNAAMSIAKNLIEGRYLQYAESGYSVEVRGVDVIQAGDKTYTYDKVYVKSVKEGSDAKLAGLREDDQIISFSYNGNLVKMTNAYAYEEIKYNLKVGDRIEYTVIHKGSEVQEVISFTITKLVSGN